MLARFASDSSVAVTAHTAGEGRAVLVAFLPTLSWFKPALPSRPIDICARDDPVRLVLYASTLTINIQTLEDRNRTSLLSTYVQDRPSVRQRLLLPISAAGLRHGGGCSPGR